MSLTSYRAAPPRAKSCDPRDMATIGGEINPAKGNFRRQRHFRDNFILRGWPPAFWREKALPEQPAYAPNLSGYSGDKEEIREADDGKDDHAIRRHFGLML